MDEMESKAAAIRGKADWYSRQFDEAVGQLFDGETPAQKAAAKANLEQMKLELDTLLITTTRLMEEFRAELASSSAGGGLSVIQTALESLKGMHSQTEEMLAAIEPPAEERFLREIEQSTAEPSNPLLLKTHRAIRTCEDGMGSITLKVNTEEDKLFCDILPRMTLIIDEIETRLKESGHTEEPLAAAPPETQKSSLFKSLFGRAAGRGNIAIEKPAQVDVVRKDFILMLKRLSDSRSVLLRMVEKIDALLDESKKVFEPPQVQGLSTRGGAGSREGSRDDLSEAALARENSATTPRGSMTPRQVSGSTTPRGSLTPRQLSGSATPRTGRSTPQSTSRSPAPPTIECNQYNEQKLVIQGIKLRSESMRNKLEDLLENILDALKGLDELFGAEHKSWREDVLQAARKRHEAFEDKYCYL